jgi:hypothetical protein
MLGEEPIRGCGYPFFSAEIEYPLSCIVVWTGKKEEEEEEEEQKSTLLRHIAQGPRPSLFGMANSTKATLALFIL